MRKVLASFLAFYAIFAPSLDFNLKMPKGIASAAEQVEKPLSRFDMETGAPDPNQIFALVNTEREKAGLSPLEPSELLMSIAKSRASDMKTNQYYAHKNLNGLYYYDQLKGSAYEKSYSCENLDLRFDTQADGYTKDWLGSPDHKRCMLNKDIKKAGYAAIKIENYENVQSIDTYIVVAIHAAD